MSIAPPGWTSSAGWKISRTRPGSVGRAGERETGAEHHRGVRVVPAGVHDALAPSTRTAGRCPPAAGGRRGRRAGRRSARRTRRRRRGRCRRAGCAARARPPSARRRRTRWCAARRGPSSGTACSDRRQPTTLARVGGEPGVEPAGRCPLPTPKSAGAGTGRMSWCSSSTVIGHPLLRGPANQTRSVSCICPWCSPGRRCTKSDIGSRGSTLPRGRPSAADGPGATDRRAGGSAANGVIRRSAHRTS